MTLFESPKPLVLIMLIVFSFCSSAKIKDPVPKDIEPRSVPVLKDVLFSEKFGDGSGIHNFSALFSKAGTYDFQYWSEGWYWSNKGHFAYSDSGIDLKPSECTFSQENDPGCKNSFTKGKCFLNSTPLDIEYLYEVKCKVNRKFLMHASYSKPHDELGLDVKQFKVPVGAKRTYQGHELITTGNIQALVRESVFLREGPGVGFKRVQYIVNAYDGPRLESVPAGKKVIVHARTVEKAKVQSWENYWLLVSIDDSRKYWAFGEFIDY